MSVYSFHGPSIHMDGDSLDAVRNKFARGTAELNWLVGTRAWNDAVGPVILQRERANAPVRTGKLRESLRLYQQIRLGTSRLEIRAGVPYYPFVVHPTKGHIIKPRSAKVLSWHLGGTDHFARMVHHPGTKGNPFAKRTLDELRSLIISTYLASLRKAYLP